MTILAYFKPTQAIGRSVIEELHRSSKNHQIEVFGTIDDLRIRLRGYQDSNIVLLLVAGDRESLLQLLEMEPLLNGLRIVLVLPDTNDDTLAIGHRLFPRFISDIEDDSQLIFSVVEQIAG